MLGQQIIRMLNGYRYIWTTIKSIITPSFFINWIKRCVKKTLTDIFHKENEPIHKCILTMAKFSGPKYKSFIVRRIHQICFPLITCFLLFVQLKKFIQSIFRLIAKL